MLVILVLISCLIQVIGATSYEEAANDVTHEFLELSIHLDRVFRKNDHQFKTTRIRVAKTISVAESFLQIQIGQVLNLIQEAEEQNDDPNAVTDCINPALLEVHLLDFRSLSSCQDMPEMHFLEKVLVFLNKTKQNIEKSHKKCLEQNPIIAEDLLKCATNVVRNITQQAGQLKEETELFTQSWLEVAKNCVETIGKSFDIKIGALADNFRSCIKEYFQF